MCYFYDQIFVFLLEMILFVFFFLIPKWFGNDSIRRELSREKLSVLLFLYSQYCRLVNVRLQPSSSVLFDFLALMKINLKSRSFYFRNHGKKLFKITDPGEQSKATFTFLSCSRIVSVSVWNYCVAFNPNRFIKGKESPDAKTDSLSAMELSTRPISRWITSYVR
jgi:hypothetical protein